MFVPDSIFGHELLHFYIFVFLQGLVSVFVKQFVESPFVEGLHFALLVLKRLINLLRVGFNFSAVEVDEVFVELKLFYLFVQFSLVLYTEVLNLLDFDQIEDDQLLI